MAKCRRTLLNLLTLFWAASVSLVDPVAGRGLDPCPGGLCSPAAEPVLVFDRTGLLFAGDFNFHLTVYANGRAVASRSVAANVGVAPDTATGSDGSSEFAHVPPEVVTDLRRALIGAGAVRVAGDQIDPRLFTNLSQVSTLTLLRSTRREGRPRANAFSFVSGDPRFQEIEVLVGAFVNQWFEGL